MHSLGFLVDAHQRAVIGGTVRVPAALAGQKRHRTAVFQETEHRADRVGRPTLPQADRTVHHPCRLQLEFDQLPHVVHAARRLCRLRAVIAEHCLKRAFRLRDHVHAARRPLPGHRVGKSAQRSFEFHRIRAFPLFDLTFKPTHVRLYSWETRRAYIPPAAYSCSCVPRSTTLP